MGPASALQQRPFTVLQLVCLAQPRPHILAASDFGSGHRELLESLQIRWNHNQLKSLNFFSVRL